MFEDLKFDCRYFRGHIPCIPNKLRNKVCGNCDEYSPVSKRILIIKLGAIGDVIRTTPLAVRFKKIYPECHITWLTHSPDVLPADLIDVILKFDFPSVYAVQHQIFDIAINLDKETEACSLLKDIDAKQKFGFTWQNSHIALATPQAEHKLITGLFDNISKTNTKNYLEEIFEICHLNFEGEPYVLNFNKALAEKWKVIKEKAGEKKAVGLNTGCGKRWQTRLWPDDYWLMLIEGLKQNNLFPVLLGGADEHEKNLVLEAASGAFYPGHYSLQEFISLTSNCDVIVTQVSMMMHIAMGLHKPLVLMNNIFNPHEFYLYNNGVILGPESGCDCYYGNTCKRERHCMLDLTPQKVLEQVIMLSK
ncbi:MAG: glycosyltransferase family 9 protein [Bacteroidetes bacterium]|nr:glycosyltransferase family 9 protein [Bacteroidales bacterium]NJO69950.1 glycosyltransferase family 9 protein [Bacteroidota bacterium]